MTEEIVLHIYPAGDDLPSVSPPCVKVFLALEWSGLPHRTEHVKGDPKGVSPSGRLPAIRIGGEVLSDSIVILDRLEEMNPPRRFWPEDPVERTRDRLWEHFINDTVYWLGFYTRWRVPENRRVLLDLIFGRRFSLTKLIGSRVVSKMMNARAVGQGVGLRSREEVRTRILRSLDMLETGLGDPPFFGGRTELGRADLAVAAFSPQANYRGVTPWSADQLLKRPRLIEHARRVFEACELPVPKSLGVTAQATS